jgi:hypothetical protein
VAQDDAERLIAEALRAQAARTPLPSAENARVDSAPGLDPGSGYGLLSGSDLPLALPSRPSGTARLAPAGPTEGVSEPAARTPVPAILLLAVLLGLAAGAVVGLLTLV